MKRHGNVVRELSSHGKNDAFWLLQLTNLHDGFKVDLIKIQPVTFVIVCAVTAKSHYSCAKNDSGAKFIGTGT